MAVAGYLAAAFLAWPPFLIWPGAVAVAAATVGAARGQFRRRRVHYRNCALISGIAIAISAVAVVWGFYANANGLVMMENRLPEPGQARAGR